MSGVLTGVLLVTVAVFVAATYLWHTWEAVAAQDALFEDDSPNGMEKLGKGVGLVRTRVLWKCKDCHCVKVEFLYGSWTLEQVRGGLVEQIKIKGVDQHG